MDTISCLSSKPSKFPTIFTSLLLHAKLAIFMLDKPTSIGMTAFAPCIKEKGVSPVDLLGVVQ